MSAHTGRARPHELRAAGLSLAYGGDPVVLDVDLAIPPGLTTVIVGANGSGKSTLLRGMARLLKPAGGAVLLDGAPIHERPAREVARVLGILPQGPITPEGITVLDLVGRGRHPHQSWFRQWTPRDDSVVAQALEATATANLAQRRVEELSGGQRQRVWIAMALAQDPDILLLDEPTTFLDVTHQLEVLDLLHALNRGRGTTVVMVLHDLNMAARYADQLVVMKDGRVFTRGTPASVMTAQMLADAFGLSARVVPDPVCGVPMVVPLGRFHTAAPATAVPASTTASPTAIPDDRRNP